jgi:hypothetical protein
MNITFDGSKLALKVGDIVYAAWSPAKAGVIVSVEIPAPMKQVGRYAAADEYFIGMPTYVVQQPNGKTFRSTSVRLLSELIADHERKLRTHKAKVAQLEALKETLGMEEPKPCGLKHSGECNIACGY